MTDPLKPFPSGGASHRSVQAFKKECDQLSKKLGKRPIDLSKAIVANQSEGDGNFQITYASPSDDLFCGANINWLNHHMDVLGGKLSEKKGGNKTHLLDSTQRIPDACSVTRGLVGEEELAGQACKDGVLDAKLADASLYKSAQLFLEFCAKTETQETFFPAGTASFDRVRLFNPYRGDGDYSLIYENPNKDFFCEAQIETNGHRMALRYGRMDEFPTKDPVGTKSMTDACSMTTALVGDKELVGDCKDRTEKERDIEGWIGLGLTGIASGLAWYATYKIGRRFMRSRLAYHLAHLPIWRRLGMGYLSASAFDGLAGLFLDRDNPIRKYGTWAAGITGVVAPSATARALTAAVPQAVRTAVATRLASSTVARGFLGKAARFGRLAGGVLLVTGVNWAWRKWITDSDYQSYVNTRVSDIVYDDEVYDFSWWDLLIVPAAVKGIRAGCRWVAPDMMNSAITYDNEGLEDRIKKEDRDASVEAEKFLRDVLPTLLTYETGADPQATIAMLRDEPIKLNRVEREAGDLLVEEGADAVVKKYALSIEEIDQLAFKYLLAKVQEAASYMVFVDQDVNDWARKLFNSDGTLKGKFDDEKSPGESGRYPYMDVIDRFPYQPPAPPTPAPSMGYSQPPYYSHPPYVDALYGPWNPLYYSVFNMYPGSWGPWAPVY